MYLASIRQQAFPQVTPEILLKELFEPQAALFSRHSAILHHNLSSTVEKFRLRVYDNEGRTNPMRESY